MTLSPALSGPAERAFCGRGALVGRRRCQPDDGRAGVGRGGLPWKRPDTTKEDWPKFAIVERHLGPLKNQMIDIESHLVNQDWYTIESDMPFVRAEVGDLDEIMGCFPHL